MDALQFVTIEISSCMVLVYLRSRDVDHVPVILRDGADNYSGNDFDYRVRHRVGKVVSFG